MITNLTIAYITSREQPMLDWFLDSLDRQLGPDRPRIVVVDFWKDKRGTDGIPAIDARGAIHVTPKPNVWQGPHRITKVDWWATSSARNTGLCLASTPWLAYVDDLCVLGDKWVESIRDAMRGDYIVFGAYQKSKKMVVEKGVIKSQEIWSTDNRARGNGGPIECSGQWLYGCSLAGPTEKFLSVGGWPEMADGLSFEDCLMGFSLQNNGFKLKYDERMFTTECEDEHFKGYTFRRTDKGVSPNDKSHAALAKAQQTKYWDNPIPGGIRAVRDAVLRGEPFPVQTEPTHDWYDQQPISEMT